MRVKGVTRESTNKRGAIYYYSGLFFGLGGLSVQPMPTANARPMTATPSVPSSMHASDRFFCSWGREEREGREGGWRGE